LVTDIVCVFSWKQEVFRRNLREREREQLAHDPQHQLFV